MLRLIVPVLYMLCIYLLSSIPGELVDKSTTGFVLSIVPSSLQNLLHVPLYAGLSWSYIWASHRVKFNKSNKYAITFMACTLFAASDEIHQMNVIGRYGSLSDFVLDIIGISIGLLITEYKLTTSDY